MLERLYALPESSSMWRVADLCYGIPSPLWSRGLGFKFYFTKGVSSRLRAWHCLGLQPALEEASSGLSDLTASAYVDDIAVTGPLEQAAVFFQRLSAFPSRCQRWAEGHSVPLIRDAVPLLGSMVGLDGESRRRSAADRVRKTEPLFRALRHPQFSTQAAFLLLRLCALPKFDFTCRTLPPRLTSAACDSFDKLALGTAVDILRLAQTPSQR